MWCTPHVKYVILCFLFNALKFYLPIYLFVLLSPSFSQLRAQNQVLKKAIVDEQANSLSLKVKCHSKNDNY